MHQGINFFTFSLELAQKHQLYCYKDFYTAERKDARTSTKLLLSNKLFILR